MKTVEGLRKQNPNKGETAVIGSEVQYDGGLFVGGAGDIVLEGYDNVQFTLVNVSGFIPLDVRFIVSATATDIIGLKK